MRPFIRAAAVLIVSSICSFTVRAGLPRDLREEVHAQYRVVLRNDGSSEGQERAILAIEKVWKKIIKYRRSTEFTSLVSEVLSEVSKREVSWPLFNFYLYLHARYRIEPSLVGMSAAEYRTFLRWLMTSVAARYKLTSSPILYGSSFSGMLEIEAQMITGSIDIARVMDVFESQGIEYSFRGFHPDIDLARYFELALQEVLEPPRSSESNFVRRVFRFLVGVLRQTSHSGFSESLWRTRLSAFRLLQYLPEEARAVEQETWRLSEVAFPNGARFSITRAELVPAILMFYPHSLAEQISSSEEARQYFEWIVEGLKDAERSDLMEEALREHFRGLVLNLIRMSTEFREYLAREIDQASPRGQRGFFSRLFRRANPSAATLLFERLELLGVFERLDELMSEHGAPSHFSEEMGGPYRASQRPVPQIRGNHPRVVAICETLLTRKPKL